MGFIAATLGSSKNKKLFVEHQDAAYPDFSSWKTQEDPSVLQKGILQPQKELLQPKKKNRTPNIGLFQVARLVITQNDVV